MARRWPHRVTLDRSEETHAALDQARYHDGACIAARLRALVALWDEQPALAQAAAARASQLARARPATTP